MANIPGINSYTQPDAFARDTVNSTSASIPGGLRVACVIGEGLRQEAIVYQAIGGGADGSTLASPDGTLSGRFFALKNYPVVSGRTEVYLNNVLLRGIEQEIDDAGFSTEYDYRIDINTGHIELQSAIIADQNGSKYSASSLNRGTGYIADGTCGSYDLISILDTSTVSERWTIKAISVIRDSSGSPIPGKTTFTATGAVSGQLKNSAGQPYLFKDSYKTGTAGAVSGTADPTVDGFVVAVSTSFADGDAVLLSGDATSATTNTFVFAGDLVSQGQVMPGDYLLVTGYDALEIESISYDATSGDTTITLVDDALDATITATAWAIYAKNLFIDDPSVLHNGTTGVPASEGSFAASDIGKVLMICSGDAAGLYTVTAVTSSRRLRVASYADSTLGYPTLYQVGTTGIADSSLSYHLLQTNGVLLFGISSGAVPFEVGDKFFIDVDSKVLAKNDSLSAKYIAEADLNAPEYFTSKDSLFAKFGLPSVTNTLSLGAQLAFENGAPGVYAIQAKPPIPRRTTVTLLAKENSRGIGGFSGCGGSALDCEPNDLLFMIPRSQSGTGKPHVDSNVNIFVVRGGTETQIFPNRYAFYSSALETTSGQLTFISGTDTAYSYTIVNTNTKIDVQADDGVISAAAGTLTTGLYNFNASDIGKIVVVQSLEDAAGTKYTTDDDVSTELFGSTTPGIELIITGVISDSTVSVVANDGSSTAITGDGLEVLFYVKDESNTTDTSAALLLHRDLVASGILQAGDGIKISYIDQYDADFFDTGWASAFEAAETIDCQIVVPLPTQTISDIFAASVSHCELMSSISIQKERMAFIGAQTGITPAALLGTRQVAIEDLGVLEGIQGDDPEEVLAGNTEDLTSYKLNENYTSNRSVYFYPDQIVKNINGINTYLHGFYVSAAAAGWLSSSTNIALPLTNKALTGFTIPNTKKFSKTVLNSLGGIGATVLQPINGGGLVLAGRTTSTTGYVEDEEISVMFVRDHVKEILRQALKPYIGNVETPNTAALMTVRAKNILASAVSKGLITEIGTVRVEKDKVDPRQWNVYAKYRPAYPINYIFIDLEVGIN